MATQKIKLKKLNHNQRVMLQRRGLDPRNYMVIKDTYVSLYLMDLRTNTIKIITKYN